jgi:hypothetical protein
MLISSDLFFKPIWIDFFGLYHDSKSMVLLAKLTALLIVALAAPDNCILHTLPSHGILLARQILLILAMTGFLILQCLKAPFIDPVSNASEWVSRMGYVITSLIGLVGVLATQGSTIVTVINGPILYM